MWAITFFDSQGPTPSLKTHLIANVSVLKFWFQEAHLPPTERCGSFTRFIRYAFTLSIYLLTISILVSVLFLLSFQGHFS